MNYTISDSGYATIDDHQTVQEIIFEAGLERINCYRWSLDVSRGRAISAQITNDLDGWCGSWILANLYHGLPRMSLPRRRERIIEAARIMREVIA